MNKGASLLLAGTVTLTLSACSIFQGQQENPDKTPEPVQVALEVAQQMSPQEELDDAKDLWWACINENMKSAESKKASVAVLSNTLAIRCDGQRNKVLSLLADMKLKSDAQRALFMMKATSKKETRRAYVPFILKARKIKAK